MSHASATGAACRARCGRRDLGLADADLVLLEQAPDARLVEPPEEPARCLGPRRAPGSPHGDRELVADTPDVHRPEHAGRLSDLVGLLGTEPEADGLPVDRQTPFERRPLIHQLHGGQHNDPVIRVGGEPHAAPPLVVEPRGLR